MKKLQTLTSLAFLILTVPFVFADQPTEETVKIKIPERTVVPVKLIKQLKGDSCIVGQSCDFEVSRNIIIDNHILIKRGAPAYGFVTSAEKAGYVSQGGKIGIAMDYCKAVDNSKVYLRSILGEEAEDHMGFNIAASMIFCSLILLAKGDEAEIPAGREFRAYVENDAFVEVIASNQLSDEAREKIEQKEKEERERKEKERERKEKERQEKEKAEKEKGS
jgi:hypothetical protein